MNACISPYTMTSRQWSNFSLQICWTWKKRKKKDNFINHISKGAWRMGDRPLLASNSHSRALDSHSTYTPLQCCWVNGMSNCYCCKKETKPQTFVVILFFRYYFSSILIWKQTVSNFVSWKEKRKPKQKTKQRIKTGRIRSTGSLHKCQLSPLINYLVSAVSSSLHLLLLELFSYGKVCWYSAHRVKGKKRERNMT